MAAVITEMPNVGGNTLTYTPESWRMLSGILEAVRDQAKVDSTYVVAFSFGGRLALRCALEDSSPRILPISAVSAPRR